MVGQKVTQDLEPRKQAGALVRRGRVALQVIYHQGEGHRIQLRKTAVASGQGENWTQKGIPYHPPIPQRCQMEIYVIHTGAQESAQQELFLFLTCSFIRSKPDAYLVPTTLEAIRPLCIMQ